MARHELNLLENALDSFNESLRRYNDAFAGEDGAYKFAILHFAHFVELLLKYYVELSHPLLIYKNPFSKSIQSQNTIGLWEAVQFLKNEGRDWDSSFIADLEWLKRLRNEIEHHKFSMDVDTVRKNLGRLTRAVLELNLETSEFDIRDHIEPGNLRVFEVLSDEYAVEIEEARKKACEAAEDGVVWCCNHCGNDAAAKIGHEMQCQYCGEVDPIIYCCICGSPSIESEMTVWNDEHPPHVDYACEYCNERIMNMD